MAEPFGLSFDTNASPLPNGVGRAPLGALSTGKSVESVSPVT